MASIVFADATLHYDGRDLERRPLGGTETSVIRCSRELALRGHQVTVFTNCDGPIEHEGVAWRPLSSTPPCECDLKRCQAVVAVRLAAWRALGLWPAISSGTTRRPGGCGCIGRCRSWSATSGQDLFAVLPRRNPHIVLPFGLPEDVRGKQPLASPPRRHAIFASNPQRNLRRLVEIWASSILPRVPDAVLDVYGVHRLAPDEDAWALWEGNTLPPGMPDHVKASVRVHPSASRQGLIDAMRASRVMLYLGHKSESFCISAAEAQALGVPAVFAPVTALPERVIDGVTGFVRADETEFAERAVALLTDDGLWRRQHEAALQYQQGISWSEHAGRFEAALLGDLLPIYRSVLALPPR
jgi:hypothetical protein